MKISTIEFLEWVRSRFGDLVQTECLSRLPTPQVDRLTALDVLSSSRSVVQLNAPSLSPCVISFVSHNADDALDASMI